MLFAQLSDTHIKRPGELAYGKVDTAEYLAAAVAHLNNLSPEPELVLLTGDVTDHGSVEQLAHVRALLAPLRMPVLPIPGNHDRADCFAEAFPDLCINRWGDKFSYKVEHGPLQFCMLDSAVPGRPDGWLANDCLDKLSAVLRSESNQPVVIAVHHPPVAVGIEHMDKQNLRNPAALAEVIAGTPRVLGILCGHVHRTIHARLDATPVVIAPSPAHAVSLDLQPGGPSAFCMEPPAVLLHRWDPEPSPFGQLITHVSYIQDYGPSQPFFGADGRLID